MIVHVHIDYKELEELCEADGEFAYCRDYDNDIEIELKDIEFDMQDLEDIVDEYLDDILKILAKYFRKDPKVYKKLTLLQEKSNNESF
ncbi:hypothetical protein [Saccharolobus caldissimus]|uniref:Uncharacterized protein n=1 Tax=Saccharolobus caldissimus TaxID=1702097 RepID=A0AAQ4CPK1_9CREN|nr:hypothetical protein [Saccharolobus caldissimus]BDB97732.1 hypothetical protein SACC_07490 [Saccharolobus caldissimus]